MTCWLRWLSLSSGLCLGSGCELAHNYTDPSGPRYAGWYAEEPATLRDLPRLNVVSFNVQFSKEYARAAAELASSAELADADIILLQEMDVTGTTYIAKALGYDFVYYPGSVQHGRDFGNAVLSRWPIVADEKILLPHANPTDGRVRIAVCATLHTPMGDLRAYSVHLETPWLGPRARMDQAQSVLVHARGSELATIIGGDFNTGDPGALGTTVDVFERAGFLWASREAGDGLGTLDLTFVRDLGTLGSGTVSTRASDHRPLWADVEILY
jgi:endonuclease/exonuclease/phosphatase family metal-dependent hydrolase